jgi:hypothetical protein
MSTTIMAEIEVQEIQNDTPLDDSLESDAALADEEFEDPGTRIARLFLEDFVITSLLRHGRALRPSELIASSPGFTLSRAGLKAGLAGSRRVVNVDREWEWALRAERARWSREEKNRQPLASALEDFLKTLGKPVNAAITVRELANLRSVVTANIKEPVETLLRDSRFAVRVNETTWLHSSFLFDPGAPTEDVIRRENEIESDPDWIDLQGMPLPEPNGSLTERAVEILETVGQPLSRRLLGYMLWQQTPEQVTRENLLQVMSDRTTFASLVGGYITLQSQLPQWRSLVEDWLSEMGAGEPEVDAIALLRQRLAPDQIIAPRPEDLETVRRFAKSAGSQPFEVAGALSHGLEVEADDPRFAGALQGLNDALRRDATYLPLGIGRFILRDAVPPHVGEVPEILRPVHLEVRNTETNEPLDIELTDEGLEGDAADFVHSPQWEDVSEEIEVRAPRRESSSETSIVLLNHHLRAGTLKLRRMDEEFFRVESNLTRLNLIAQDEATRENVGAWASRDAGLIYGLGDWLTPRVPPSGARLLFTYEGQNSIRLTLGEPDKATLITPSRLAELEALHAASKYLSLYELLQNIMADNQQGAELSGLWAEVNVVRRTSKRLLASVLCAYHCFYFKQRGPQQILWRYDATRLDQGFKRNKRKYVRK